MVRLSGVDVPNEKRVEIALTYIHGIGLKRSQTILSSTDVSFDTRAGALTDAELVRIREFIENNYQVEGDLRREVRQNITRLMEINCYRGQRHRRNLPARGQRTRTNARQQRGKRQTVAGRRRATATT
ncbi:MAG: 30S ribosomal protein S13 [Dehalococcoidia bacterium]|nr:30S ribosomal protein S13 [Dehalococcoidia bacterium]|tara:strand:- start:426 stop:809 length:384 start_codon:yes stop_codon:yes gene_type:complete